MTPKEKPSGEDKAIQNLEEICENTRAIRRVVNRILDHLHEYGTSNESEDDKGYDLDKMDFYTLDNGDDMYM